MTRKLIDLFVKLSKHHQNRYQILVGEPEIQKLEKSGRKVAEF